jgi:hypothetical protein
MLKRTLLSVLGLALSTALIGTTSNSATAGQAVGWWGGDWNCNIDGRPARMKWKVVDDSQTTCNGDTCSISSGVRWQGYFSDNSSPWVALAEPRRGNLGGLFFRHADGNQWYLPKPTGNRTSGWTTWNGQRYSLSCWR